eukprot:950510_1
MSYLVFMAFLLFESPLAVTDYLNWITGTNAPPELGAMSAVGFDGVDTIFILGGDSLPVQQVLAYNVYSDAFTVLGNILTFTGDGGYDYGGYAQVDDILYVHTTPEHISTFNMSSLESVDQAITLPEYGFTFHICLTASNTHLFMQMQSRLEIYDIANGNWLSSVPTMNTDTVYAACIVHNDKFYAIGGYSTGASVSSVQTLFAVAFTDNQEQINIHLNKQRHTKCSDAIQKVNH